MRYRKIMASKGAVSPGHLSNITAATQGTGADFLSRRIYLVGEINEEAAGRFLVAIQTMDDSEGPITVVICSSGGDEASGYAMYDALKLAKNPVTATAYGECMSIAMAVLQGAELRLLSPTCQLMVHNGYVGMWGGEDSRVEIDKLVKIGEECKRNNQRYYDILAARSGLDGALVKTMCDRETFMSAQEAIRLGFADGELISQKIAVKKKKAKK